MLSRVIKLLEDLMSRPTIGGITAGMAHDSLDRLEKGLFGKCEACTRGISPRELASNPAARLCTHCQAQAPQDSFVLGRIFPFLFR